MGPYDYYWEREYRLTFTLTLTLSLKGEGMKGRLHTVNQFFALSNNCILTCLTLSMG